MRPLGSIMMRLASWQPLSRDLEHLAREKVTDRPQFPQLCPLSSHPALEIMDVCCCWLRVSLTLGSWSMFGALGTLEVRSQRPGDTRFNQEITKEQWLATPERRHEQGHKH